ncbi:putative Ig domain-containing protein [Larkinella terrae]|uniref:T9SS type A sorting domain-containing protein n=1 Tax=Larkinella terrae TaxID=2025311 RepID=A0A7K0EKI1_9BACT|nr:putative Ig domain-containing protein [Larkinella terrae]MRS61968.1 hypothetical protein [Larkinella terrae]
MFLFYHRIYHFLGRYRAVALTLFWAVTTLPTFSNPSAITQTTWTGSASSNWATAGNWSDGVPTTTLHAIIPSVSRSPQIENGTAAVAKSVEVQSGASLTIVSGGSLTINDFKEFSQTTAGALLNDGTVQNNGQLIIGNTGYSGLNGLTNRGTFTNNTGGTVQIDRTTNYALYNSSGTFTNAATITIGSIPNIVNGDGIYNTAVFNNNSGALIQIDRVSSTNLNNFTGGTFTNAGTIVSGTIAPGSASILSNSATFNNTTGGSIQMDKVSTTGLANDPGGTFTNSATITIGNNASGAGGSNGVINQGNFNNNAGGSIQIDRTFSSGIYNISGTFTNAATITIGANASVGRNGIENRAKFDNKTGGTIQIDQSSNEGLYNWTGATFTNAATIKIGSLVATGVNGFSTSGEFKNNAGGIIQIDRSSNSGWNSSGTVTNEGTIKIGTIAQVGDYGIRSGAGTFNNNTGGTIQIDRYTNSGWYNGGTVTNEALITIGATMATYGIFNISTINNNCGGVITTGQIIQNGSNTFTNGGLIIEKASGNSSISSNTGLVQNLNGGTFSITTNTGLLTTTEGPAEPTITATPSLTVNAGQSVTLTAGGATSYRWSTSETTPAITVTVAGPYSVTGTLGECARVTSVTLTVNVVTDVTVTNPPAVCAPATVDLTQGIATSSIPNATFYFYTDADGTQPVPNPAAVGAGIYYVKAVSQEGSPSALKPLTVVVKTPPTVSISPNNPTICSGQSVTLTASGARTYLWNTTATSTTLSVSAGGPYSVTGTTDGCSATATQTVTENSIPAPTLSTNVSSGNPGSVAVLQNTPFVTLTASGCAGTLSWTGPNTTTGPMVSVPTSTTGSLIYTVFCQQGGCTSSVTSFTVSVTAPTATGSFDGFVNGADCESFRGWAWDRNKVNTAVSIQILDGPNVIGTLLAGDFRQDLLDAGKGNGKHAFRFTIPTSIRDGLPHNLSARIEGSSFILKDSPKVLICATSGTPTNKPPVAPTPTVLIAPLTAQVGVPFSGTLVAFTDPEGQALTYKLSGLPGGLSINEFSRVISGTPTADGTFVLTYSATDTEGATNSVSFNLTINPAQTTTVQGNFEGYLDKVECGTIRGWVWDRNKPNTPVTVEFYTGSTVWGSTIANIYRDDLKNAGKGNGVHAYSFEVPNSLKDGTTRLIYGRVQGSNFMLKDSGKPLTCGSPARISAETGPELSVTLLGNPVTDQVALEIRGAVGQAVNLHLSDASGRLVNLHRIELAKPVERYTIPLDQQPAGLLLLRVNTVFKTVTLKIVKN